MRPKFQTNQNTCRCERASKGADHELLGIVANANLALFVLREGRKLSPNFAESFVVNPNSSSTVLFSKFFESLVLP